MTETGGLLVLSVRIERLAPLAVVGHFVTNDHHAHLLVPFYAPAPKRRRELDCREIESSRIGQRCGRFSGCP